MKKIPTLFERTFENHKVTGITDKVTPGFEWVLAGEGTATVKIDGSCCAVINGELYKRYDAKKGKKPPVGAIPCCDPDPVTGHWPHWVKCSKDNPADKWFWSAYENCIPVQLGLRVPDVIIPPNAREMLYSELQAIPITMEAVGQHFQGNPYGLAYDVLIPHGTKKANVERTFDGIKQYLAEHNIEGLVFWKDGEPQCKIKRTDFGLPWPVKTESE